MDKSLNLKVPGPRLAVIQSSHASLGGLRTSGLLDRHARTLRAYRRYFDVTVYSMDTEDFSEALGVPHVPAPWLPRTRGLRHVVFWAWLMLRARSMGNLVKVFGSNTPTLWIVKLLSRSTLVVTYQYDYADYRVREHGAYSLQASVARLLVGLSLWPADLVIVTTPTLAEKVERRYRKKTVLLPNWIDLEYVDDLGQVPRDSPPTVLYAGRLHFTKGLGVLLDAFADVQQRQPNTRLIICGLGSEEVALRRHVMARRLGGVTFAGRLENRDVLQYMSMASVFVLPTLTAEGHPKGLVEAMACGAPCVASDVPGNRDVIDPGVTGLLVPPGDPSALAAAVSRVLGDPALANGLGAAAAAAMRPLAFETIIEKDLASLIAVSERRTVRPVAP